jgi:hypothetical protein
MAELFPVLSSSPVWSSIGENFSWITIKNNVPRELYAQAVYNVNNGNNYYNVSDFDLHQPTSETSVVILSASADRIRRALYCRNMSTAGDPLYIKYGEGATDTSFNIVLKASFDMIGGTEQAPIYDGLGETLSDDQVYQGVVSVYGVNPRFVMWEGY